MTVLLVLTACTGPSSKPTGETADSTSIDTGDSAVDSETAESDTSESDTAADSDTGETADTAPPIEWSPGDDIPGWEDADCTEAHPGRTYVITYPDTYAALGTFLDGMPGSGPHLYSLQLRDCANFPCAADTLDVTVPYVNVALDGTAGDGGLPRGTGEWGPDESGVRHVLGDGRSMLIDWDNGVYDYVPTTITVCIERLRPDEVRGAVRVEVTALNYPYNPVYYYDTLVYRFPFDIRYPDHAGFDATQPDVPADQPLGYTTAHYTYEQSYDAAWPWDDITDPSVREQVYERYTPYNAP